MFKAGKYISSLGKILFVVWVTGILLDIEVLQPEQLPWWFYAAIAFALFTIGFVLQFLALGKQESN